MKLTEVAINAIKESLKIRNRLCLELDRHSSTINRMLDENAANGLLTTVKSLQIISEESGLAQDQILTKESAAA